MQPEKGFSLGKAQFSTQWVTWEMCSSARMLCQALCGPSWDLAHGSPFIAAIFKAFNKDSFLVALVSKESFSYVLSSVAKHGQQTKQDQAWLPLLQSLIAHAAVQT